MRFATQRQSRADLERLLDGLPVRRDAVADVLAAARTSGMRADTAGLPAALAAFRSISHPHPADQPRRNSMIKNVAAKLVAAKLLTISGLALAATGGIAAAASTGHLPSPLPHSSHASEVAIAAVASSHGKPSATPSSSTSASPTDSASATESDSERSGPSSTHPEATPSPSLRGLCQSWMSRPHEHGKADTNPAFTVLVAAAGDTDSVNGYCASLLASGHPTPSATPSAPSTSHAAGKPSTVPSASHPTGKPSTVPSASHPAGKPSTLPTPTSRPTGR